MQGEPGVLTIDKLRASMRLIEALPPMPRLIESDLMFDIVEDWSRVRSPSRARRRMKYGHRQNVISVKVPKPDFISLDGGRTLYAHPITMMKLRRALELSPYQGTLTCPTHP
jgi:hypothetical protein